MVPPRSCQHFYAKFPLGENRIPLSLLHWCITMNFILLIPKARKSEWNSQVQDFSVRHSLSDTHFWCNALIILSALSRATYRNHFVLALTEIYVCLNSLCPTSVCVCVCLVVTLFVGSHLLLKLPQVTYTVYVP